MASLPTLHGTYVSCASGAAAPARGHHQHGFEAWGLRRVKSSEPADAISRQMSMFLSTFYPEYRMRFLKPPFTGHARGNFKDTPWWVWSPVTRSRSSHHTHSNWQRKYHKARSHIPTRIACVASYDCVRYWYNLLSLQLHSRCYNPTHLWMTRRCFEPRRCTNSRDEMKMDE